jgi:hypothetical protein
MCDPHKILWLILELHALYTRVRKQLVFEIRAPSMVTNSFKCLHRDFEDHGSLKILILFSLLLYYPNILPSFLYVIKWRSLMEIVKGSRTPIMLKLSSVGGQWPPTVGKRCHYKQGALVSFRPRNPTPKIFGPPLPTLAGTSCHGMNGNSALWFVTATIEGKTPHKASMPALTALETSQGLPWCNSRQYYSYATDEL